MTLVHGPLHAQALRDPADEYTAVGVTKASEQSLDAIQTRLKAEFLIKGRDYLMQWNREISKSWNMNPIDRFTPWHSEHLNQSAIEYDKLVTGYLKTNNFQYDENKFLAFVRTASGAVPTGKDPRSTAAKIILMGVVNLTTNYYQDNLNQKATLEARTQMANIYKNRLPADTVFRQIYKISKYDPEFAKVVDLSLATRLNASVNEKPEQIRKNNPAVFQTEKLEQIIQQATKKSQKDFDTVLKKIGIETLNAITKLQEEQKRQAAEADEKKQRTESQKLDKQNRYELAMKNIDVWSDNLVLAGQALRIPPPTVNAIVTTGKAAKLVLEAQQILDTNSERSPEIHKWATLAATGNCIQAGLLIGSLLLSNGPSTDEIILKELALIRQEILELRKTVVEGFNMINETLARQQYVLLGEISTMLERQKALETQVANFRSALDSLQQVQRNNFEFSISDDYKSTIMTCLPSKYKVINGSSNISKQDLNECSEKMVSTASSAGSAISLNAYVNSQKTTDLQSNMRSVGGYLSSNYGQIQLIPFINGQLKDMSWLNAEGPLPLVDLKIWRMVSADFIEMAFQQDIPNRKIYANALYRLGQNIQNYSEQLLTEPTGKPRVRTLNAYLVTKMVQNYSEIAKEFLARADELSAEYVKNAYEVRRGWKQKLNEGTGTIPGGYKVALDGVLKLCESEPVRYTINKLDGVKLGFNNILYHSAADRKAYEGFLKFRQDDKKKLLANLTPQSLKQHILEAYKIGLAQNHGVLRACIDISSPKIYISTTEYQTTIPRMGRSNDLPHEKTYTHISYDWVFDLNARLKVSYIIPGDTRRNIAEKAFHIFTLFVPVRNVHWSTRMGLDSKNEGLTAAWNEFVEPKIRSGNNIIVESGSPQTAINLLSEIDQFLNNKRKQMEQLITESPRSGYEKLKLQYEGLVASLSMGSEPLFHIGGDNSMAYLFSGPQKLLTPNELVDVTLQESHKSIGDLRADIDKRAESAITKVNALKNVEFRIVIPEIDQTLQTLHWLRSSTN